MSPPILWMLILVAQLGGFLKRTNLAFLSFFYFSGGFSLKSSLNLEKNCMVLSLFKKDYTRQTGRLRPDRVQHSVIRFVLPTFGQTWMTPHLTCFHDSERESKPDKIRRSSVCITLLSLRTHITANSPSLTFHFADHCRENCFYGTMYSITLCCSYSVAIPYPYHSMNMSSYAKATAVQKAMSTLAPMIIVEWPVFSTSSLNTSANLYSFACPTSPQK